MGSQQLLLIILGIVIVGIAVAVGITIFNSTAVNSSRNAIISDMMNFATLVVQYFKTPSSLGGSSYGTVNWDEEHIKEILGFQANQPIETENAYYNITELHNENNNKVVVFSSIPKEGALDVVGKRPKLKVTLAYESQGEGNNHHIGLFKLEYY